MDALPASFAANAESCSVRFVWRGTANPKCTALVNVGAMLLGLRPSGRDARANTKPTANVEPQRRDSSSSIGCHPNVEKTVRIPSETKSLQKQKLPLSHSGILGPAEPVSSRGRTPFPSSIAVSHSSFATISFPFREVQGVTAMSRLCHGKYLGAVVRATTAGKSPVNEAR